MQIHTSAALPNDSVKLKTCTITTIIFSTKASLRKKPTLVCKCASVQVCTHQEETETAHHKRGMRDGVFVPQISLCVVLFYFFFCTFSLKSDFLKVDSGFRTSLPMHGTTKSAISSISDFAASENTQKKQHSDKKEFKDKPQNNIFRETR